MADTEQLVRARAVYRGEDPDAAWAQYSGASPMAAPAPVAAPVAPTSNIVDPWAASPAPQQTQGGTITLPEQTITAGEPMPMTAPNQASPMAVAPPSRPLSGDIGQRADQVASTLDQASYDQRKALADADAEQTRLAGERDALRTEHVAETAREAERQGEAYKQLQKDREESQAKIKALDEQIAKTNIRDRRTTANKAAGAIAMAFAGIGDAIAASGAPYGARQTNHLQNVAGILDKLSEDDYRLQAAELENLKGSRAAQLNQWGMVRDAFQDDMAAREYFKASRRERYLAEMDRIADGMKDAGRKAEIKSTIAEVSAANEARKFEMSLRAAQEQRLGRRGGGGGGRGKPLSVSEQLAISREERAARNEERDPSVRAGQKGARISADLAVADPEVAPLHVQNASSIEKLQGGIDEARNAIATIDRIVKERNDSPLTRGIWWTDANDKLSTDDVALKMHMKNANTLGVLTGPDLGLLEKQTGDATGFRGGNTTKIMSVRRDLAEKVNNTLRSRGFAPVDFGEPVADEGEPTGDPDNAATVVRETKSLNAKYGFRPVGGQ